MKKINILKLYNNELITKVKNTTNTLNGQKNYDLYIE